LRSPGRWPSGIDQTHLPESWNGAAPRRIESGKTNAETRAREPLNRAQCGSEKQRNLQVAPRRLGRAFFARQTLNVARELLGQKLIRLDPGGVRLSGWIIETEAYIGSDDLGCHARHGRTARNESMWGPAGRAYVYFTYGKHWMLNIVTEAEGLPAAVLIRGLFPDEGLPSMRRRRRGSPDARLTDGPAKLCQALGINRSFDGVDLCRAETPLFLESLPQVDEASVTRSPRVGLNSVPEPWQSVPWRFRVRADIVQGLFKED